MLAAGHQIGRVVVPHEATRLDLVARSRAALWAGSVGRLQAPIRHVKARAVA
jgi:hypothetical protein